MNAKLTLAIAVTWALGCGGREEALEQPVTWLERPLALGNRLVLIERVNPRAFLLDAGEEPFDQEPLVAALPHGPFFAQTRNGARRSAGALPGPARETSTTKRSRARWSRSQPDGEGARVRARHQPLRPARAVARRPLRVPVQVQGRPGHACSTTPTRSRWLDLDKPERRDAVSFARCAASATRPIAWCSRRR